MNAINGNVLIKPTDRKINRKNQGFILDNDPETTPEYHTGIVKKVEPGKEVRVGDTVTYRHFRNLAYKGMEIIKFEDIILYGPTKSTTRNKSGKPDKK